MHDTIFLTIELIGTVSFALSGAVIGVRKKLDLFGVMILALTTACGGGCIRDVLLGITPPNMFRTPIYAMVALGTSLILFMPAVRRVMEKYHRCYDLLMFLTDTIGLGLFTVVGVQTAANVYWDDSLFLMLFIGVLTGCGGSVLRDIMTRETPQIFVKHFYACASLVGALIYVVVSISVGELLATIMCTTTVIALRCLAAYFHWNLPKLENTDL